MKREAHSASLRLVVLALALFGFIHCGSAQLQVDIKLKRTLYVSYEPILITVSMTNLSGNPLPLSDANDNHWFGFQVETLDGRPIAPRSLNYTNESLVLEAGQKLSRTVNLTPLFPIGEFGGYRIRAAIYAATLKRFFNSPALNIEITDGRPVFQKIVGVPDGMPGAGETREITAMTHRLPNSTQLYLRIENKKGGTVFCTHRLGRLVSYGTPEIILDQKNQVHILQNAAPKSFLYSHIGLNGEVLQRKTYSQIVKRPILREGPDGKIQVIGAQEIDPAAAAAKPAVPSLSDRPVALPDSATDAPADEKRPNQILAE
ncbi:MAG: hypothetical protein CAK90_02565 [Spartobacteria bacterium AMD-G4]|nr:MAG: hypothetical protein CAK90_02565 [Spartobacteria bacterium AMD-G4]